MEGTFNKTADGIYIVDYVDTSPENVHVIRGHTSFPLGVDVDPSGRYSATVHAGGEVFIWQAQQLKEAKCSGSMERIYSPCVDADGKFIVAREKNYGFLRILDTVSGEGRDCGSKPSHAAAIAPTGDWLVRFYWDRLPINPYSMDDANEDAAAQWFDAFKQNVPVCCYLEPMQEDAGVGVLVWEIAPNINIGTIAFDPAGESGAAIIEAKDQFAILNFCFADGRARYIYLPKRVKPFGLHIVDAKNILVFSEQDGNVIVTDVRLNTRNEWSAMAVLQGFGARSDITCGPLAFGDRDFALVKNWNELISALAYSRIPEAEFISRY